MLERLLPKPLRYGLGLLIPGTFLVFFVFSPVKLVLLPVVFTISALMVGYFTKVSPEDRRGFYSLVLIAFAWYVYIAFSKTLFPEPAPMSDLFFQIMGRNILNAFCVLIGVIVGSLLRKKFPLPEREHPWETFLHKAGRKTDKK